MRSESLSLQRYDKRAKKLHKRYYGLKAGSQDRAIKLTVKKWEEVLKILEGLASLTSIPFYRKIKVAEKLPIKLDTNPLCWTCAPLCPLAPTRRCVGLCSTNWRALRRVINKKLSPVLAVEPCRLFVDELRRLGGS